MDNGTIRVLLVEDDPEDYYLTRELLADIPGSKIALEWAADFDAGLEALARCQHDACLLDYRLGKGDGLHLLRESLRRGCKAPVILLTGQADRDLALEALAAGAADYLVKGKIDAVALERSIRYALQQKRHADELEGKVRERTAELERANAALRTSEERYRLVVEGATGFAIMLLDHEGRVTTWNVGAERLFGYAEPEVVGEHFARFFMPEDAAAGIPDRELRQARDNERGDDDNWLVRKDGSRFWASGATTALRDEAGGLRGYAKVVRDITERKQAEEALKETDRRKDEFLAMLAHELRNPLAPLSNALAIVRLADPKPKAAVQEAHNVMERQVEHLVRLVDDLLDVARITRGKSNLQLGRVDLATVVARAVEGSRPLIDARKHALEVVLPDEELPVAADPVRLAQVLWNLLNNAAKYTPEGGRIGLHAEKEDGQAVVRVKDTGMGIAPEMLPRVFDLFTQMDRTLDRAEGGLGIGLTLVRRLTEMHGGTVEATSAGPGQGSEFVVRLPLLADELQVERPGGPAGAAAAARTLSGRRILVVDDNLDSAESLAILLRLFGNDVRTAHDGRLALETAAVYRPDVMLLDIGLPGMDGLEVCRRLRQLEGNGRPLIVAMTGYGQDDDRRRSQEAGFNAHLVKPVDIDALQELLSRPELAGDGPKGPIQGR